MSENPPKKPNQKPPRKACHQVLGFLRFSQLQETKQPISSVQKLKNSLSKISIEIPNKNWVSTPKNSGSPIHTVTPASKKVRSRRICPNENLPRPRPAFGGWLYTRDHFLPYGLRFGKKTAGGSGTAMGDAHVFFMEICQVFECNDNPKESWKELVLKDVLEFC